MAVTTTQFKLFGEPEVNKVRKARRKMSEREKEERREKKALEKRLAADKEFERKWAERGVFQGQLFADDTEKQGVDENKMKRNMKKKLVRLTENDLHRIVKESVNNVLNEGLLDVAQPVAGQAGRQLADLVCNQLQNDKQNFVPLIDRLLKYYLSGNQQLLQYEGSAFVSGICDWIRRNKPEFYKGRQQMMQNQTPKQQDQP